jgi:AcrR family transcriptional regulator
MRKTKKNEIVKSEILEAAQRVFQRWGLRKSTMEDIAREAGKGKSTLYYYYRSKEEIFYAVASSEIAGITALSRSAVDGAESAHQKLRVYVYTAFNEMRKLVALYGIVRGEIRGNAEALNKLRRKYDENEGRLIEEILTFGVRSKEFRSLGRREIGALAHAIVVMIRSLQMNLFIDDYDKERVDTIVSLMLKGL